MSIIATCSRQPWNKGKLVGQIAPLRLRDIWAIRVRLQIAERTRDLALFDLALDSKLRASVNQASCARRRTWRARITTRHGDAAENAAASAVRSPNKQGLLSRPGYTKPNSEMRIVFVQASCIHQTIYPHVNMHVSSKAGWTPLALIQLCMALTQ